MKSPFIVGLASIIPGLGLWIIGRHKHALLAALLVIGAMFIFLFSPWETLSTLSFYVALLIWVLQSSYAVNAARVTAQVDSGLADKALEGRPIASPAPHLDRFEKQAHKARELIRQQLNPGESLMVAVPAFFMSYWRGASSYSFYYVGLLQDKLIIVEADLWGKPASVRRIPFSCIDSVNFKHGLLQDHLNLAVGDSKPIKLRITRFLREHTDKIAERLTKACEN